MCISDLLWWHSHTPPPLFFSFYAVEISFPVCCLQRRRHLCVMIYITFVLCALYHQACSLTYCSVAIFQGLAWGRVERKKEKKNTFWQWATATVFYDPLHVIIAREMGREKKDWITCLYSLWGLWAHFLLCCDLNAPSALTNLHLRPT